MLVVILSIVGYTIPVNAKGLVVDRNHVVSGHEWAARHVENDARSAPLIIDAHVLPWLVQHIPALSPLRANQHAERLIDELAVGKYTEIYWVDRIDLRENEALKERSSAFELEVISEKSLQPFVLIRLSRVVDLASESKSVDE